MKRTTAAMALAASAALLMACGPDAEKSETANAESTAGTTVATPSTPVIDAPAPPEVVAAPSGPAAAPGAPSFAVLYPGASLDEPAVTASGPAGPGGLVTYTTEADPEAVIAFYKARAEAAGLASTMAMNQGEARAYSAVGSGAGSNLQVVASPTDAGETSVQLSWSGAQ